MLEAHLLDFDDDLYGQNIDVAFIGTNGFSVARGLTTPDTGEGATKRAMLRAARRSVVLADASKFGADQFVRFGTPAEIDTLITDTGLDPARTRLWTQDTPGVKEDAEDLDQFGHVAG